MSFLVAGFIIVPALTILLAIISPSSTGWLAGLLLGLVIWLAVGFWMLLGLAYDGCDSLDPDNMCVETSEGQVRV